MSSHSISISGTTSNSATVPPNAAGQEKSAPTAMREAPTSFVVACQTVFTFISPFVSISSFLLTAFYAGLETTMGLLFFFAGELTLLTYLIVMICIGVHHFVNRRS